jgi:hypothetical protein
LTDVSEKHIVAIFGVQEWAKQGTSVKEVAGWRQSSCETSVDFQRPACVISQKTDLSTFSTSNPASILNRIPRGTIVWTNSLYGYRYVVLLLVTVVKNSRHWTTHIFIYFHNSIVVVYGRMFLSFCQRNGSILIVFVILDLWHMEHVYNDAYTLWNLGQLLFTYFCVNWRLQYRNDIALCCTVTGIF